jgi:hypothetical protein
MCKIIGKINLDDKKFSKNFVIQSYNAAKKVDELIDDYKDICSNIDYFERMIDKNKGTKFEKEYQVKLDEELKKLNTTR